MSGHLAALQLEGLLAGRPGQASFETCWMLSGSHSYNGFQNTVTPFDTWIIDTGGGKSNKSGMYSQNQRLDTVIGRQSVEVQYVTTSNPSASPTTHTAALLKPLPFKLITDS